MTDQSIFTENKGEQPSPNPDSTSSFAHLLSAIKNENGQPKYASVEKALEALAHSQGYILEQKAEIQARDEIINHLKGDLSQRSSVEDLITRLTKPQDQQSQGQPPTQSNGLDMNALTSLVNQAIENKVQTDVFKTNLQKTESLLKAKFGDKVTEVIAEKASELGLSAQKMKELAGTSPAAILAMFGVQSQAPASVTTGSVTIPGYKSPEPAPLERPKKSLLSGATSKEQAAYMREIKEAVYRKYNVEINK